MALGVRETEAGRMREGRVQKSRVGAGIQVRPGKQVQ